MKKTMYTISIFFIIAFTAFAIGKYYPHVYPPLCVGCADCYQICPKRGRAIYLERGKAIIDLEECIGCKKCIWICSYGAVY